MNISKIEQLTKNMPLLSGVIVLSIVIGYNKQHIKAWYQGKNDHVKVVAGASSSSKNSKQQILRNWCVSGLDKNLTSSIHDPGYMWLSVSQGAYLGQYYSRDTFITFLGASTDERIRNQIAHSIDWFGNNIKNDNFLPLWYGNNPEMQEIIYCPFLYNETNGGIKQLDHILEFILAIHTDYLKTNNKEILNKRISFLNKTLSYLDSKTDQDLLVGEFSAKCGNDWADQVRRSGKSSFINALWYVANRTAGELYKSVDMEQESKKRYELSNRIKEEYNKTFWTESNPTNCHLGKFGHYSSWIINGTTHDYFDIDSNTLAVSSGLANKEKAIQIMSHITKNWPYYTNKYGATRVVCGWYNQDDTSMGKGISQNGAYWYINSYFLTAALNKSGQTSFLNKLLDGTLEASVIYKDRGLTEWYYEDTTEGGAMNYSWSMGYPLFLMSVLNGETNVITI